MDGPSDSNAAAVRRPNRFLQYLSEPLAKRCAHDRELKALKHPDAALEERLPERVTRKAGHLDHSFCSGLKYWE